MANPALRRHLEARSFIAAPGVYDMISALIADRMGFKALYVTGYGGNTLYRNGGDGTFTDVSSAAGVSAGG